MDAFTWNGIRVVVSPLLPMRTPKVRQLDGAVAGCSPEVAKRFNDWLNGCFGYDETHAFMLQGKMMVCSDTAYAKLRSGIPSL